MDAQVASGLSVVGALVEARTLAVHGKKEVSVPENFQEERNFPVAHLETLILVVVLNPTWTGEVKELPLRSWRPRMPSATMSRRMTASPGASSICADGSAQTNRQVAAKQMEVVPRSSAEDEEAW